MSAWRAELNRQWQLALPLVTVNVALMAMGVVDSAMVGHLSTVDLAAVGLGHAYIWCVMSFGLGVLMALDPLVAQAHGAQDEPAIARAFQRGLLLALLVSAPVIAVLLVVEPVLGVLGQPADVVPTAAVYTRVSALGVPAMLLFYALRQSLQALGRLRAIVVVAIVANVINAFLDWVLVWGRLGAPQLGAEGCALATVLCEFAMLAMLVALTWPMVRPLVWPVRPRAFALEPLRRMFFLGAPIGFHMAVEVGAFHAVTFFMGRHGTEAMAGHRAALVVASVSFMVPLGIGMAAAVRVGHDVGAGDVPGARLAARISIASGALVMLFFAALFSTFPEELAGLFSSDPEVVVIAASLLPLAAAFQLFDGLQVVSSGVLRGVGEVRWPFVVNLIGYWCLGLPLGLTWSVWGDGGPQALWWGLVLGLAFVALTLLLRVRRLLAGDIARIDIEGEAELAGVPAVTNPAPPPESSAPGRS